MALKMNKVADPSKRNSPIQPVVVRGKNNMTASNIKKKTNPNKVVDPNKPQVHGKPLKRTLRTSIVALKKEETKNVQNKRIWLKKAKVASDPRKAKKVGSVSLVKNISINQKRIKVTKR